MSRRRAPTAPTGWSWSTRRRAGPPTTWWPRRAACCGTRKVGHSGTLDPDATGVLLLGVGRVTRLLRFLTALPKTYTGEIVLGTETSTLDASGEVTATHDMAGVTRRRRSRRRPRRSPATSCRSRRWSRR